MAVAAYTTDLADISTAESLTGWAETTTWAAGATPILEPDFFIQNANCIAKYMTTGGVGVGGFAYNFGSGVTIPSPGAFFVWINQQCPNNVDTLANGGIRALAGSGIGAFYGWAVDGKDTLPYGGWKCYPIDPSASVTRDYTVGSPSGTWQYFGIAINQLANAKGGVGCDVIRYGRGQLKVVSGQAGAYGTFSGAAAANDAGSARWGLCQAIPGGYLQQGLFLMGEATTTVDFRDSNTSVLIANTTKVVSTFNLFEIRHASSRVDWTSISFQALGTVSRGNFTVTDNATVNWSGCTFTDTGLFSLLSSTTATNCIFRRTDKITTNGATLTNCTVDSNRATSAVLCATPANAALITNTTFISDGTGYAIEITGAPANITLTGNSYTGYASADGTSGNEAIFVNTSAGSMNLTISGGTTPSIRVAAGVTVTVISGAVNISVKITDSSGTALQNAAVHIKAAAGGPMPYNATVTITNSGTTATVTHTAHGMATNDKVVISGASHQANNGVYTITKTSNDAYTYTMGSTPGSSPTGTIKSTYVVVNEVTDVNGNTPTVSRVFSSAQPITGWARKASGAPFYKTSNIAGTISSTLGFSVTTQLILDQ